VGRPSSSQDMIKSVSQRQNKSVLKNEGKSLHTVEQNLRFSQLSAEGRWCEQSVCQLLWK